MIELGEQAMDLEFTKTKIKENILKYCINNYSNTIAEIIEQIKEASKIGETYVSYKISAEWTPENKKMLRGLQCYFNDLGFDSTINSLCSELTVYLYKMFEN